jgi:site-specific DNA-methyltransferase (adenine-specific)
MMCEDAVRPYYRDETTCIFHGDCLEILPRLEAESMDLIYLDPPFNTGKDWTKVWKGETRTFADRFPGMAAYVGWMEERVREMRRVLKPTGSLWLHTDPHHGASYLKVMLDGAFGIDNYHGEIVWKRKYGSTARNSYVRTYDVILVYGKTEAAETLPECNGADPCACTGMWLDIPGGRSLGNEDVGYPTQKPERLLERIVRAGSKPDDIVLDPFMGSGTTLAAATKLGRYGIGMDASEAACEVASKRLREVQPTLTLETA